MSDIAAALAAAAARIAAVSDTPRLDAELLMAHALGIERSALLLDLSRLTVPDGFAALVDRRCRHEPVAYIVGTRDFWTISLAVGPGVLIPRADSETLIEAAVAHFSAEGPARIFDLGTGPGTLLLAALDQWPAAQGVGVERSAVALEYARRNAAALGSASRVTWVVGDWHDAASIVGLGQFDLVLANPPYVEAGAILDAQVVHYEPAEALFAGAEGLDDYRRIIPLLRQLLSPSGIAVVEIGHRQADAVSGLAHRAGLAARLRRDLGGRDRVLLLTAV